MSVAVVELVEKTKEPIIVWLPIVLLFVVTSPSLINIAVKGELVLVPDDETPAKLIFEIVLLEISDEVPAIIPVKRIALKLPVLPVIV